MLYRFEEWELDVERYELRCSGELIKLEPQVFSVLAYLVQHRDRVLSKQELLSHLWPEQYIGDSALERCIMAARKAVGDSGGKQRMIKTFHRRGYRFVVPVTEHSPPASPVSSVEQPEASPLNASSMPSMLSAVETDGDDPAPPESALQPTPESAFSHRQVTVLSCAIADVPEGFKVDMAESLQNYLKSLYEHIAACVQSHGGLTALYRDHGLVALFGVSRPCEEHALQAVKTAIALQTSLEQMPFDLDALPAPLKLRMGLHTGDIVGKRFGDDPQRTYMAVGNTLQFAANLQACTPPDAILASEVTYRLVKHAVKGRVAGLVALESGLRHTTAYHLSHLLPPVDPSSSTSLSKLTTRD